MFEEPEETPSERPANPADRAKDKFDEFRMHAELAAVFEGTRKFDAKLIAGLDPEIARDAQKTIARLEKSKSADIPLLPPTSVPDAIRLLTLPETKQLPTNDYHIHRRPGEVMILRWLGGPDAGSQIDSFYDRFQAHFNAALNQYREEERQSQGWKQDPDTLAYLKALDAIEVKMADRYLRDPIRAAAKLSENEADHPFILSTQAADELDILHLTDHIMQVEAKELVGKVSAPPEEPTEQDRAWFFKLFSLRGMKAGHERMFFFTFLQKADDSGW